MYIIKEIKFILFLTAMLAIPSIAVGALVTNFSIEVSPLIQCNDGIDNDGDSLIDYPDDPECASATDNIEAHQQCSDNYDNDSDSLVDHPTDPGCTNPNDSDETDVFACNDGLDNDGDGLTDYPLDSGCASLVDNNEYNETGGGGGGGNSGFTIIPVTSVKMIGRAYPLRPVTLLKDGQIALETIAGPDAYFEVTLSGIAAGNYTFSLYSTDQHGNRSTLFTFPAYITSGASTVISGIFLAPTIDVDKEQVKRGDNLVIFGQSIPNSEVIISVHSNEEMFVNADADTDGVYLYNLNTTILEHGAHETKSRAEYQGEASPFSNLVRFTVGDRTVLKDGNSCSDLPSDLNCDGRVNLVDYSIAAYWYRRSLSAEFTLTESAQLNGDGKVDLVDFSIMAYYWTG